jgi:ribosomal biogenesis protein LAS1
VLLEDQALIIFLCHHLSEKRSFVNGLVDPAQQGPFARSIAAIAAQIGLPLWFVELRHASTHEDLPSLQVLRDAAQKVCGHAYFSTGHPADRDSIMQAMDWLYQRYWLAQMQSASMEAGTTVSEELSEAQKVEITGLLTQYKKLKKETLRDASVSKQKELARLTQAIERWTLDIGTSRASFSGSSSNNLDATAVGCQALAKVLAEAGFLVPMSKK